VVSLHFFENHLVGSITESFGNLKHLKHLIIANGEIYHEGSLIHNLNKYKVSGELGFPIHICKCLELEEINLVAIGIFGRVEPEILNLTKLRFLNLSENRLSANLPNDIRWLAFK